MVAVTTRRFERLTLLGYLYKFYRDGLRTLEEVYGYGYGCFLFSAFKTRYFDDTIVSYCAQNDHSILLIDRLMFLN